MSRIFAIGLALALSACATAPMPVTTAAPVPPAQPPAGMQFTYGSGEAAVASIQAYQAMRDYVRTAARSRPATGVILADGAPLDSPRFVPCGDKPLAVVLDIDETALLNLGYEYDESSRGLKFDQERWERWERTGADKVAPVPGAAAALGAIRAAGVTPVFITNRVAKYANFSEAALDNAGVGPGRHGETLFMQGDDDAGTAKDRRRTLVAGRFCVIAMIGDQLGDFSDLFNARTLSVPDRRRIAGGAAFAAMWGAGWFMLPNAVYGSQIKGSFDDVFPTDKRWADPGAEERK